MTFEQYAWDGIKLLAQLAGALGIARLTVTWALGRHKQEKHWEQKLKAYTEIVAVLGDLLDVLDEWENHALGIYELQKEAVNDLIERRKRGRQKVTEISALAELLLPPAAAVAAKSFRENLAKHEATHHDTMLDDVQIEIEIISSFRDFIVSFGRSDLDLLAKKK